MDVEAELLPGVGLRFEFDIRDGDRIGVIVRRSGDFEIVIYEAADPDRARPAFRLADEEADALAQILGAPRIAPQPVDLTREVPGLNASKIPIRPESPFAGEHLGQTRARTRTGASIVAIDARIKFSPHLGPQRSSAPETYSS